MSASDAPRGAIINERFNVGVAPTYQRLDSVDVTKVSRSMQRGGTVIRFGLVHFGLAQIYQHVDNVRVTKLGRYKQWGFTVIGPGQIDVRLTQIYQQIDSV